jgi:hypothetical protein
MQCGDCAALRHLDQPDTRRSVQDGYRHWAEFSEDRRFRASVASPAIPFPDRPRDLDLVEEQM